MCVEVDGHDLETQLRQGHGLDTVSGTEGEGQPVSPGSDSMAKKEILLFLHSFPESPQHPGEYLSQVFVIVFFGRHIEKRLHIFVKVYILGREYSE